MLSCNFFPHFSCKPSRCHAYIWSKNVHFVKTTIYYGPKSQKKSLFLSDFSRKNHYPHTHICQKIVHSLKTPLSCPNFVKIRSFSQIHSFFIPFSKFFNEKPSAVMHIFCPKNINSVKKTHQKVNRIPFFCPIFHG